MADADIVTPIVNQLVKDDVATSQLVHRSSGYQGFSGAYIPVSAQDPESQAFMRTMADQEKVRSNRVNNVRTVLVVLSSAGIVFDIESLRQKILLSYPEAAVFFRTTLGKAVGSVAPDRVDLLIDFTGPRQRQGIFYARKLRRMSRFAVGRDAGFFRKGLYDRVFDEHANASSLPAEKLTRERVVQREILGLVGVAFVQAGDSAPDRGKITPLELPLLAKT
jgi:hypothetical protein